MTLIHSYKYTHFIYGRHISILKHYRDNAIYPMIIASAPDYGVNAFLCQPNLNITLMLVHLNSSVSTHIKEIPKATKVSIKYITDPGQNQTER